MGLIEDSFSLYQVAYFYSKFPKSRSAVMRLGRSITYLTGLSPVVWGEGLGDSATRCGPSSSSHVPLCKHVVLALQMKKLRFREAKLTTVITTNKQVVDPQSV